MDIAKRIDHTLLKPDATPADIEKLCQEAKEHGFFSVCVNSVHVARCVAALAGSGVKACSVIGFPLGAVMTEIKVNEAKLAIADGADELDMVINIGALKAGLEAEVQSDIVAVTEIAHQHGVKVKAIIEVSLLSEEEKRLACRLAVAAKADFVKSSTGFAGWPTVDDIKLMKEEVGDRAQVKASGGIRDRAAALAMLEAGADRIGSSRSVAIIDESA